MKRVYVLFIWVVVFLSSCQKEENQVTLNSPSGQSSSLLRIATNFPETFELGSKTSYTNGSLSLGSGQWYFSDALIGTTSTDRKVGSKSARIRNSGSIEMRFNTPIGVNSISVQHAKYGTTASSTWQLYYSTDNGLTWTLAGPSVTTSSTVLATSMFSLNIAVPARFKIVKSSGSGILNIDQFLIDEPGNTPTQDDNLSLGNPSNASTNILNANNYLIVKPQFVLSYNNSRGSANWVSWHLSSAWKGTATRCDCFTQDTQIPTSLFRASTSNYTNSGFDRGHLCPSDDRDLNSVDNAATFKMSNIIPQAPNNNQITWGNFENYCRTLVTQGNEIYIVAGAYGVGGTGSLGGTTNTISNGQITVPSRVWKVALILPVGSDDVNRITSNSRLIAIDMPNIQTVNTQPWQYYRTSTDAIELQTGLDLFSNVPAPIQSSIESLVDNL